jgi:peptidoglycan/LPS O-acetylase OafA/YrhL
MIGISNQRQGNVPYLDGWRGVAILAVLLGHFGPARFWYMGRLGVVLFFVLSGLFMGRLLFIRKVPLSSFFVKRITRIVPALWVYVGTMWFYAAYMQPVPYRPQGAEFLSMLSFSSTYLYSIWEMQWPVSQLWSLNVEEHGYVFLALGTVLIAKSKERLSASVFLGITMLTVMGCIVLYMRGRWQVEGSPWRTRSEVASLGLIASAYFCVMKETGRMKFLHKFSWLPLAALALALASFLPYGNLSWNFSILVAPLLAAFAVNHAASFPEIVKRILSVRVLRWFGTCSFSIYLWQGPFYVATKQFGASHSLCLLFSVVAGALSYYAIENPARLYWNRKWDEFRAAKSGGIAETVV